MGHSVIHGGGGGTQFRLGTLPFQRMTEGHHHRFAVAVPGFEACGPVRRQPGGHESRQAKTFLVVQEIELQEIPAEGIGFQIKCLSKNTVLVVERKRIQHPILFFKCRHQLFEYVYRFLVLKQGDEIILPKKEFELLSLLFSKPGKVFTREEILHSVWGDRIIVGDRTIDVHIRKLREKIGDELIKTVKGVGYKLLI